MINKNIFVLILSILPFSTHAVDIITGQHSLEFHGYFRGGFGLSESGTTQAKFQAPGTRAAYRLGNEPDTNLELQFNYNYDMGKSESDKSHVQGVIMLDGYKAHGESNEFSVGNLAQGYLSFNQFFNNDVKLWLGRRYYDRKDIHIMDHTWLNSGQGAHAGFGIENIKAGTGKLNLALFRYEDIFSGELINSTGLDIRWRDLEMSNNSKLTLWAGLTARHKVAALNYASKTGYGIGAWLDHKSENISNTSVILYQSGPAITQGDYNARPIREDIDGVLWNLDDATVFEVSNTLTYEKLPNYSVQWTVMARQEDHGLAGNSKFNWYSMGARPIFYFSKHLNLALEASIDSIDDKLNNRSGTLTKFTTALQISADRGFYNRPVMRLFITLADWSDELKGAGLVGSTPGNAPYANDTQGWSIGAQAEVWW